MLNQPKFKSCFHIEVVESVGVFLLSESDQVVLSGRLYEELAPLLSGRTVEDIINLLQGKVSAAEVYYALMQLERKGYIVEADSILPTEVAAFWHSFNINSQQAAKRLQSTTVSVQTCGTVSREPFTSLLALLNIQVGNEGDIEVVLTDDYLQENLEACNQKALQLQRPWMIVKPVGKSLWIGPIFHPGKTGCWECLAQRLRDNRPVETFIQKRLNLLAPFPTSTPTLPTTLQTALNLAATELAKWIVTGENQQLVGQLITVNAQTWEKQSHVLVKRPQCRSCGNPNYWLPQEPSPITLKSQKKTYTADGGHRTFSPEETLKKHEHQISPITGVVRSLVQVSAPENSLTHTYIAGHNFAMISDDLYFLRENVRGKSGGKGRTSTQAKASGFCEAIERYSGIFQGYETRKKSSYQRLGELAIHPHACMLFSEEQYKNRAQWNANSDRTQQVPEPFNEESEIDWTPVWSLTEQTWKYLPTAYCYYGYPLRDKPFCYANSNGCAAGNTLEEAILQGFLELAERDAVAMWWYNQVKRPSVEVESFDDPYFHALKDYYYSINRSLWVLDITCDFNIPTFAAISRRTDKPVEDILYGFGTHFDPKIALNRALTEVNQCLPAVSSVAADGSILYPDSDELAKSWWQTATLENQAYLIPDASAKPKSYSDYHQLGSDDLKEDVMACVEIAKKQGMEVLVLDQTRPDIGLNVVRVIVPGLRMFWKRLGAGRLYEVPVKLGWLPEPNSEHQLNPFPIWF